MNMDKILDRAIEKDASDVNLICGNKPMLRIARELVPIEEMEVLTVDDMNEMYDFLVRGNVDKDELFNTTRKLDTSYEYNGIRLRVNISEEIKELIVKGASTIDIRKKAIEENYRPLVVDGIKKVLAGDTTLEEVNKKLLIY